MRTPCNITPSLSRLLTALSHLGLSLKLHNIQTLPSLLRNQGQLQLLHLLFWMKRSLHTLHSLFRDQGQLQPQHLGLTLCFYRVSAARNPSLILNLLPISFIYQPSQSTLSGSLALSLTPHRTLFLTLTAGHNCSKKKIVSCHSASSYNC